MEYALVTGGSRGIGSAIARQLAADGFAVIINYKSNDTAANNVANAIRDVGGVAELLRYDVTDAGATDKALESWENEHPDDVVSVVVNNAGIRRDTLMVFMDNDTWHDVLDTTLDGFFYTTRRLLKGMLARRRGRIINVASLSGLNGLPGQVNYSAAKSALIGATRALAREVAPRKVTVNAVAPGFIHTDMTAGLDEDELKKSVPMRRFGEPHEVADLVSFLASERAAYITGQVISINGGLY